MERVKYLGAKKKKIVIRGGVEYVFDPYCEIPPALANALVALRPHIFARPSELKRVRRKKK